MTTDTHNGGDSLEEPGPAASQVEDKIAQCHKILRAMTGVFLVAFGLIIIMTTFSTGPFVQTAGKGFYYLIVLSGLVSLMTWLYRTQLEKRLRVPPIL
jgi:hypothetical protein